MIKCPKCGSQARVPLGQSTTLMGYTPFYYDEEGDMHTNPDPNTTWENWRCTDCGEEYTTEEVEEK